MTEAQSSLVRWLTLRPWLGTVARLVLGAVWIWAAVTKLGSPRTFVQAVRAYDATPEWLSKAIGYGLPVLEICLGALLIIGIAVRICAAVSAALCVVFLIGIIQAAARGLQLECGCFGGGGETQGGTTYTLDILRDVGLLILAAYLVVWSFSNLSIESYLARHDDVPQPSAKRMRSDQGRRKYNALVEARRKEALSRTRYINASLAAIVVLIALIGIGVQAGRAKIEGTLTAVHASVSHGVTFGKKAAATVDIYEDFQCPNCLNFEKKAGAQIDRDVRANKAQVHFHIMSFLDSSSNGNQYSTRAANAALCASDGTVDLFVAYHNLLYGKLHGKQVQPAEGSHGRPNSAFVSYAQAIGIKGSDLTTFTTCVQDQQHKALVQALTEQASKDGVNSTPTIKVNGKSIKPTLAAWNSAVADALKKGPAPNPSKTPSPTPTTSSASPSTAAPNPSKSSSGKARATPSP